MAILDLFVGKDAEKYGKAPPPEIDPAYLARMPNMDPNTLGLHTELPRGVDMIRPRANREAAARWANQMEMEDLRFPATFTPGQIPPLPLGSFRGELIGYNDDRAMITLASARAGKSTTVLEPALLTYPGSMLVFDPKGELAEKTAAHREKVLGHKVAVLDPYGITSFGSASFNVLDELSLDSNRVVDDALNLARAVVVAETGGEDGSFWAEGGRELLKGVILSVLQLPKAHRNLVTVRQLLTGAHPSIRQHVEKRTFKSEEAKAAYIERLLLSEMARPPRADCACNPRVTEIIMGIGTTFGAMPERTRGSMLAMARQATQFLDSLPIQDISKESHFRLADLRQKKTTIYLVLPGVNEIKTHYRWLRMMFETAASVLMRMGTYPRNQAPMIFLLEEFPVLGHLEIIEAAAAQLPGYGIKLHLVAQNLSQIKRSYPESWQTFFGNAGLVQCFANTDDENDLAYVSRWLGTVSFEREKAQFSEKGEDMRVTMPLLAADEIRRLFARQYNDQILMIPGHYPYAVSRMTHAEVDRLRFNVMHGRMSIRASDAVQLEEQAGMPEAMAAPRKARRRRAAGGPATD